LAGEEKVTEKETGNFMKVETRQLDGATLISISGRIDSETSPEVARAFQTVQDQNQYNIIVDMVDLEYMSSATLRALMAAQRVSRRNGGEVVLLRVPEKVWTVLDMAGLVDLFKIVNDPASLPQLAGNPSTGSLPAEG
jgi:anti-sigma B factor antagonist